MKNKNPREMVVNPSPGILYCSLQSEWLQRAVENEVERQHGQDHQGGSKEALVPETEGGFMPLLFAQGEDQDPRRI